MEFISIHGIPQAGAYTLTSTPYSKSNAGGKAGKSLTIHFTVVDKSDGIAGKWEQRVWKRMGFKIQT